MSSSTAFPFHHLEGLRQVALHYEGFIIDLLGVMHDGIYPYAPALACYRTLCDHHTPVVFVSNSDQNAQNTRYFLEQLGLKNAPFITTHTCCESFLHTPSLRESWGIGTPLKILGKDPFFLPPHDITQDWDQANSILITGPFTPQDLKNCAALGRPIIWACASLYAACLPLIKAYCADVPSIICGKPHPLIYQQAFAFLNLPPRKILAIGDSWSTDITGALKHHMDVVWINPQTLPPTTEKIISKIYILKELRW